MSPFSFFFLCIALVNAESARYLNILQNVQRTFDIVDDCGAVGDGRTDNTQAITKCIQLAANYSSSDPTPTLVMVPEGVFVSGAFNLTAKNVYIYLMHITSVLRASYNASLYPCVLSITQDTGPCNFPFFLIYKCTNCGLIGPGSINGGLNDPPGNGINGYHQDTNMLVPLEWALPLCTYYNCRPKLIIVQASSQIVFSGGVHILNSPLWTLSLDESENIVIEDAFISGDRRFPNNDGIDVINSQGVLIRNTTIQTGDDCIAIITHTSPPINNVLVENCTLSSSSAAIKVAVFDAEATGTISNLNFNNITITDTNRGVCFDPRVGQSTIQNVSFTNIQMETHYFGSNWWGKAEPIQITSISLSDDDQWNGTIRDILFENITARSENGIILFGNSSIIRNVTLKNIKLEIDKFSNISSPSHDWRPTSISQEIVYAPTDGIYLNGVDGIEIKNVQMIFVGSKQQFWGECINSTRTANMRQEQVACSQS
jgi:polygalacturonase